MTFGSPAVSKAFLLLSCTFLGLVCGTLYLYSSYSPQFARQLQYSVTDSSSIALMGTLGVAVTGPLAGAVVDKAGYTPALVIGGLEIVVGYLAMRRQFDSQYSHLGLSAFLVFCIGSGSTFINSACLKCCAVSFPSIRGVATSLPLALYGLSAMFYSVLGSIFYPGDTSGFLGFVAYSVMLIMVICSPSIVRCDFQKSVRKTLTEVELTTIRPISSASRPSTTTSTRTPDYQKLENNIEVSGLALLKSYKFWLMFIVTGTLASLGQMYIYSVGYMVKALVSFHIRNDISLEVEGIIQKDQQLQVSLLSIANCIGRIASGVMGDIISQSFRKSRSWLLFLPCFGLMATQVLGFKVSHYTDLSLNSLLTGFFYGFTLCIMPVIVADSFGMKNFSSNWGVVGLAPIVPSFYFTSLFGQIYDSNSQTAELSTELVCLIGNQCYNSIFKTTFLLTFVSLICIALLNYKGLDRYLRPPPAKEII